ncbi:DUF952 domain-containing protein [Actinophytocola sp.]|uniref:DUF952 domain-containing protein n=1 Tax=Actinophytocola sp. TaxID=1872138 RepID=UPI002ED133F1
MERQPGRAVRTRVPRRGGFRPLFADEAVTLAVVNAFYRTASRPLLAVLLDEAKLAARCEWEAPAPVPPPGVADGTLFPHVFGPINRDAVVRVQEVQWDDEGRATGLTDTV